MQSIEELLDEYGNSHVNPVNKLIHWVCVPIIVWTVVAILWSLPFPSALQSDLAPVNWATVALVLARACGLLFSWFCDGTCIGWIKRHNRKFQ